MHQIVGVVFAATTQVCHPDSTGTQRQVLGAYSVLVVSDIHEFLETSEMSPYTVRLTFYLVHQAHLVFLGLTDTSLFCTCVLSIDAVCDD